MAIDKKRTAPWVKAVIVLVALAFAAGPAIAALGLRTGGGSTAAGGDAYARIAGQFAPQADANEARLASEATSYTVLVDQGNLYFDWALEVQRDQQLASGGADRPIWLAATHYYERALAERPGDPAVGTDLAISYFYARRVADAIQTVEKVVEEQPDFAAARFNAGIFYREVGRTADAVSALQKYLELDPNGKSGDPQRAGQWLSELGASRPATGTR
ncbi:MAG: tetratricopeptide repeat protein [Coriobacteriia bacterium]|nr:tetratricopeptide repeat protein [Coriobacteriia bacterium]